ncbi:lytic transglycosylase domain-containing protein [Nocardia sp. NPDC059177]|uniref:lytic transglycosylase domain-containing protein n=1 Tax=Nocardia sp. NPDC059177 TaxID=3346759 RepID=UPI00367F4B5F
MRTTPITALAVLAAGLLVTGSQAAPVERADAAPRVDEQLSTTVGLLPVRAEAPRVRAATSPVRETISTVAQVAPSGGVAGIPETVLAAYRNAELTMAATSPDCGVSWHLLAGIGRIESGHAFGGAVDDAGTTVRPIYGPALDGTLPGNEVIPDAAGGFVRAVGPMQFLPSTWSRYAADGNGDGASDPQNVFDATLAAARYLCVDGSDLRDPAAQQRAVLRYNYSSSYAADVLGWSEAYRTGTATPGPVVPQPIPDVDRSAAPSTPAPVDLVAAPAPDEPLPLEPMPAAPAPTPAPVVLVTLPVIGPVYCGVLCESPAADSPQPEPAPDTTSTVPPSVTLPFGIVIPLPMPQG